MTIPDELYEDLASALTRAKDLYGVKIDALDIDWNNCAPLNDPDRVLVRHLNIRGSLTRAARANKQWPNYTTKY